MRYESNRKMLKELNIEDAKDTSDIISQGMQIGSVEVAVLFKEVEEGVKISLRSKEYVDVRKIAENFGGGGHIRASGAFIKGEALNIVEKLIETIKRVDINGWSNKCFKTKGDNIL